MISLYRTGCYQVTQVESNHEPVFTLALCSANKKV